MTADIIFLDVGGIVLEIDWQHSLIPLGFKDSQAQQNVLAKVRDWPDLHQFERGHLSPTDFFRNLRALLNIGHEVALEEHWNKLIVGPLPHADKIFDRYKGHIPICALSNTNFSHHEYQNSKFPILKRFDRFLTSHELRHRKPDPDIFLAAAKTMGVRPERSIFFDDSLANVEAAKALGFKAFHTVNSPEQTLKILNDVLGF